MCARCAEHGIIRAATVVDHTPERNEIIAMGESPYDEKFFESLCHACHNWKLRQRGK